MGLEGKGTTPLGIAERRGEDEIVLELRGELDISTADQLQERLEAARLSEVERVTVDLRALDFVDSTGLRILLRAQQAANEGSGGLAFVPAKGQVERIMQVAGIDGELTFVD